MSLCINPLCSQPNHPDNGVSATCCACGSELLLQGRYRVMRLISSQSGFGWIYEAYERHQPKILKVLKQSYNSNPKVLELFRREAQVLSQLNHPGVPKVEAEGYFRYWPQDSAQPCHCLVMEKIDGPNLKQWMIQQGNHPISEKQALLWMTQLTDVLHLIHQHNYFHRDIKPDNVMLRSSGQLVLVDFGAAREMTQTYMAQLGDSDITAVSSAGYTPPEQEQGQAVPQSDFYAMGRSLIYLITAKLPSDPTIYDPRTNGFRWRPLAPQISPPLADLIDDLIAPAAAQRPQSTGEILARLAQIRSGQNVTLPPAKSPQPWVETSVDPHKAQTLAEPSRRFLPPWLDQRPWLLVGLTGLALAIPLAWYGISRQSSPVGEGLEQPIPLTTETVTFDAALAGHTGDIYDAILLKDGHTLITASADATIRLWDLQTKSSVTTLSGHTNVVKTLATTPDQDSLISAGDDRSIRFWALPSGEFQGKIDAAHGVPINAITVSHNSRFLATADGLGMIRIWDLMDAAGHINISALVDQVPQPVHVLRADGAINDLRFSRDNRLLISGGQDLHIWEMADPDQPITLEGHAPLTFINRLEVSADNQLLISASSDKTVGIWHLADLTLKGILTGHESYVNDVRVDGPKLWSADENKTVFVWDLNRNLPVEQLQGFDTDIWRFALRPNGDIVTIGGSEHLIKIWLTDAAQSAVP
ncbi:MAG: hypothetical protein EA342_15950 [Leptolyngbya sp. LCM1.Bin17]|nr:MAG: hypothetical protein EA342_15950 [Leptolyngbya sp. LCM1.Bin17]